MIDDADPAQMGEVFEQVSNYFALLSEPTRLKVIYALCKGERAAGAIVDEIGSTQTNVSRHLNMLYRARILARRKVGTVVYYSVADQDTLQLCRSVCAQVSQQLGLAAPKRKKR